MEAVDKGGSTGTMTDAVCGACHGSGWMVRDPDIGTDQECFACGGSVKDEDDATKGASTGTEREAGLEAAAKECDRLTVALDHGGNEYRREASASQCAAAIRALKSASPTPTPAQRKDWSGAAEWLRNNYQDHANIADLSDAMLAASPQEARKLQDEYGPDFEDGPDSDGFRGPRPWNGFAGSDRMVAFEAWLRTVCFQQPTPEAYDLAKCAWRDAAPSQPSAPSGRDPRYIANNREELETVLDRIAGAAPADKVDAKRYRWLREHWFLFGTGHSITTTLGANLHNVNNAGDVETLDAEIDAAIDRMRSEDGQGGKL